MLHDIDKRQKITVMVAVMSGLFLAALDQTIIGTALGKIVEDFNSFDSLSWIVTAYLVTTTITVPISGKLSDMFGRRNMLLIGVALFTLASLLSGSAENVGWLIAARAFQGIGGGILTSSAFTIIGDLFTPKERGKWQGIFGAVFGLASVIGPLLGGFLTDSHTIFGLTTDWRWTFYINIPVGIAAFILIFLTCPNFKHEVRQKIDFAGAGLLAITLTALIFACENTDSIFKGLIDSLGISGIVLKLAFWAIAIIFGIFFVLAEKRAESPILSLSMFKRPIFRIAAPIVLLYGAAFLGAILYLTQFLQQVLGASPTASGLMLMPLIFSLSITSAIIGRLVSTTGKYKRFLVGGVGLVLIGILSLTTLGVDSTFADVAWRMAITGIGLGASFPIFNLIVQNEASQRELGMTTAAIQLSRGLGSTVGTALFGGILTAGVAASVADINKLPFADTLRQSPSASQVLGGSKEINADTAIQLNTPDVKQKISDGIRSGVEQSSAPAPVKQKIIDDQLKKQDEFNTAVKNAFASSLRSVFFWAAGAVLLALILSFFIRELPLRSGDESMTPVE